MDITSLSMGLSQSKLMTNVGTALLSHSLQQSQELGDSLIEMIDTSAMEQSVNPHIGANLDIRI